MDSKKILFVIPVVSALVLAVAVGMVAFSSSRAANGSAAVLFQEDGQAEPLPMMHGFGGKRDGGHGGRFGFRTDFDYDAYLAEELGVTVDELQDARQAAHAAALEQAVAEGVISEEQADLFLSWLERLCGSISTRKKFSVKPWVSMLLTLKLPAKQASRCETCSAKWSPQRSKKPCKLLMKTRYSKRLTMVLSLIRRLNSYRIKVSQVVCWGNVVVNSTDGEGSHSRNQLLIQMEVSRFEEK